VDTGVPLAFEPAKIETTTGVVSLAVPVNVGVVLFESEAGWASVTTGGLVSTLNVTGWLTPSGLWSELSWLAVAVYSPVLSDGLALPDFQAPPVPVAVALETTLPPGLEPL
jgi:hypothetical protein